MKIIGYARVSTDNQKEEGTIEIQEEALKEYAETNGYEILNIFKDEGVSGSLENRPGLSQLFYYLENHRDIEGVLIFKLDRLARDLYIQEHLIKQLENRGKKLYSIKEPNLDGTDPLRKAFRQFIGIVSELEKAFITMRLSGGRINKARKGGYAGGRKALGYYVKDKDLLIDTEQAEVIRSIFTMRKNNLTLREIAWELNRQNIPTARVGKQWYARTVKKILDNPIYKGQLTYKNESCERLDLALVCG